MRSVIMMDVLTNESPDQCAEYTCQLILRFHREFPDWVQIG
ncbi:MAG: hypothetical protein ACR2JB_03760 [Bryobacteraceae bacterium]